MHATTFDILLLLFSVPLGLYYLVKMRNTMPNKTAATVTWLMLVLIAVYAIFVLEP